jgi:acyl-CoA reductase-like NAD-dependent aldehyde dehydrogenase
VLNYAMTIDGKAVESNDKAPVINPALGEPFATCSCADASHLDQAVNAAQRAFPSWRKDEATRREAMKACANAIRARAADIATLLTQEQGKPIEQSMIEAYGSAVWFDYYAALDTAPETIHDDDEKRVQVVRKPLGVVGTITPWNFPVILWAWKLAPALLAGNTVVAKPSPYTPLSTLLLAEVLRDGLPPGVLNVLAGGAELGAEMTSHPGIRKIAFTGSAATGRKVLHAAADDLKRVTLELGGNDPAIVLDDAKPEAIIDGLFWGAFFNSGQVCAAIKRLYLPSSLYEPVVAGLIDRAKSMKVGNGLDPDTKIGPINNEMQLDKLASMVESARSDGARVETGGARLEGKGYFYPPTIVTHARQGMRIVDEEQFGTALPIIRYDDVEDAIAQANNTNYGLSASIWTSNRERGESLIREIDSGTGWVNHHADFGPHLPFGGVKHSGIGLENGRFGYHAMTGVQVINVKK